MVVLDVVNLGVGLVGEYVRVRGLDPVRGKLATGGKLEARGGLLL
jgi:hypothetical protein